MTYKEFLKLNPYIQKVIFDEKVTSEDLIQQGRFLESRTFIFYKLNVMEAEVLKLRLGIIDGQMHSHQEIADILHTTQVQAQKRERDAMLKLARKVNIDLLINYDDNKIDDVFKNLTISARSYAKSVAQYVMQSLREGDIEIKSNIPIDQFFIPADSCDTINRKFLKNGIKTLKDLTNHLKEHGNVLEFVSGEASNYAVIFGVARLIEDGTITVNSKITMEKYYHNKNLYSNYLKAKNLTDQLAFPTAEQIKREKSPILADEVEYNEEIEQIQTLFTKDLSVTPLEELNISKRLYNVLRRNHIDTVQDFVKHYYNNNGFSTLKGVSSVNEAEAVAKIKELCSTIEKGISL